MTGRDKYAIQQVYLVRHWETEWSFSGQHTGITDTPLSENGRRVAQLFDQKVTLEGVLLKPNMVISGKACVKEADVKEAALATLRCLSRHASRPFITGPSAAVRLPWADIPPPWKANLQGLDRGAPCIEPWNKTIERCYRRTRPGLRAVDIEA